LRTEYRNGERQIARHFAVIGSGIAGLSAAWLLAQHHRVTLLEADGRPGGHSNTVLAPTGDALTPVDTGFIVFNERNYPNLTALLAHLGVKTERSDMSFAASLDGGRLEYGPPVRLKIPISFHCKPIHTFGCETRGPSFARRPATSPANETFRKPNNKQTQKHETNT